MLGLDKKEQMTKEEAELRSYLKYLDSAMAPWEMRKLIGLIDKLSDAKFQEGKESVDQWTI
jgi:hypothetical protein